MSKDAMSARVTVTWADRTCQVGGEALAPTSCIGGPLGLAQKGSYPLLWAALRVSGAWQTKN